MKNLKLLFALTIGIIMALTACKNQQKNGSGSEGFEYDDETVMSNIEVTKSFIYAFPSPGDLLARFDEAELVFNELVIRFT